jgi:cytochrome c553
VLVLAIALSALGAAMPARADDLDRGKQLFKLCAVCHGAAGQGHREFAAPAIAGLPRWYVEGQLAKFKHGQRAYRAEDAAGLQMRPMARSLVTDADVRAMAAYVASLPLVRPLPTLTGDAERGRAAYAPCVACHGERAAGNEALKAPALTHQADWYLAAQLKKFREGLRGTHPGDATGALMRPMAMTLGDDAAIRDVVVYIRTLGD